MKRDLDAFESRQFDLLVIGGGIYGACVARDAALRGLDVALIEQGDFSSATSHNSAKIVHGGIRYLQHLDLVRVRESVTELGIWLSIAPHLVRPLKFVIPTQGYLARGPVALLAGILLHWLVAAGTQRRVPDALKTHMGRIYSKSALGKLIPGLPPQRLTGAASWYDGQLVEADRIVLECIAAAAEKGAVVANYVSAESILRADNKICGVAAVDRLSGRKLEVRARTTVVTGGPWAGSFLAKALGADAKSLAPPLAKNMNIVVPRILGGYGVGLPSQRKSDAVIGTESRLYFLAPWKNVTLIGTTHFPYSGAPGDYEPSPDEVQTFLDEFNAAYPPANLTPEQVLYVYSGLTPADPESIRGEVGRAKRAEIIDHALTGDADGLITVIGVKYTTSRLVAERVVDLVQKKMGASTVDHKGRTEPLPGARRYAISSRSQPQEGGGNAEAISDLLAPYGGQQPTDLRGNESYPTVFEACVRHAVHDEMAMTLEDVLLRRLDLVERGMLTDELLNLATRILSEELGWSESQADQNRLAFRASIRYLAPPNSNRT